MNEKQLILFYKDACSQVDVLEDQLKTAKKAKDLTEFHLVEHLRSNGADKTASYDGLGSITAVKPRLYASCSQGNNPQLFDWLHSIDRAEIIKPTVHAGSLSSLVKEQMEEGFPPPEFVSYYYKESVRLNKPKM